MITYSQYLQLTHLNEPIQDKVREVGYLVSFARARVRSSRHTTLLRLFT
jgi:hypothetical protein